MKVVSKVLVTDQHGDILMLRRSDTHPRFAHHLDFPGGKVETGESPTVATAREIKEETGLIIRPADIKLVFNKKVSDKLNHVLLAAAVVSSKPNVMLSWEHEGYQWMSPYDLLKASLPKNPDQYYVDVIEWMSSRPIS